MRMQGPELESPKCASTEGHASTYVSTLQDRMMQDSTACQHTAGRHSMPLHCRTAQHASTLHDSTLQDSTLQDSTARQPPQHTTVCGPECHLSL